jgi:hypothetical protein
MKTLSLQRVSLAHQGIIKRKQIKWSARHAWRVSINRRMISHTATTVGVGGSPILAAQQVQLIAQRACQVSIQRTPRTKIALYAQQARSRTRAGAMERAHALHVLLVNTQYHRPLRRVLTVMQASTNRKQARRGARGVMQGSTKTAQALLFARFARQGAPQAM